MSNIVQFGESRAYFSLDTPYQLRVLLDEAIQKVDLAEKEQCLLKAREQWPLEPDAHISLYKFYFVTAQYPLAEKAVLTAMCMAAAEGKFNRNYRRLTVNSSDWSRRDGAQRLYLFSLKALGVCRLRRGRVFGALSVLKKLLELDRHDEIGGGAYLGIAKSFYAEE